MREFYSLGTDVNRSLNLDKNYDEKLIEKFVGLGIKIDTLCRLYFRQSEMDASISSGIVTLGMGELSESKLKNGDAIPSCHPYFEAAQALHTLFETA